MRGGNNEWTRRSALAAAMIMLMMIGTMTTTAQNFRPVEDFGWGFGVGTSAPFVVDFDGDGLLDLFVGIDNHRILHYEQRAGDKVFVRVRVDAMDVSGDSQPSPFVTDLDGDGLKDILVGTNSGEIRHFEQVAAGSDEIALVTKKFNGIEYSDCCYKPIVLDLDGNGLLDLIVGDGGQTLRRWEQSAPNALSFNARRPLVFPITRHGTLHPYFHDLDGDGALELLVSDGGGALYLSKQSTAVKDSFTLVATDWNGINANGRAALWLGDLDADGLVDLLYGTWDGMIFHYEQPSAKALDGWVLRSENFLNMWDLGSDCMGTVADLDKDGRYEVLRTQVLNQTRTTRTPVLLYRQMAAGSLQMESIGTLQGIEAGEHDMLWVGDFEDDGRLDMLITRARNGIEHYRQSTGNPLLFELVTATFITDAIGNWTSLVPQLVDLDKNGKKDLLLGNSDRFISRYEQVGAGSASFEKKADRWMTQLSFYPAPAFVDLGSDGRLDMLLGQFDGNLDHHVQNASDPLQFNRVTRAFLSTAVGNKSIPHVVDFNKDGRLDLVISDGDGGMSLYLDMGPNSVDPPEFLPSDLTLLDIAPHPVRDMATLRVHSATRRDATLRVFDVLGREVSAPMSRMLDGGTQLLPLTVRDLRPGVYLLTLESAGLRVARMVVVD